jgi:hypothetical protein
VTRFLRWFRAFRDIEAQVDGCNEALRIEIRGHDAVKQELATTHTALELERTRRISAESIASERRQEIDRLLDQANHMREDISRVTVERLRSVDALNLKLMETKVAEIPPDITKYSIAAKQKSQLVDNMHKTHRDMDWAILRGLHPNFKKRVTLNEPTTPDEVAA